MTRKNDIYRVLTAVRHHFTAFNTLGHGIHSPSLFYLVSQIIYDENQYYSFSLIENERKRLLKNNTHIYVEDYGTGTSGVLPISEITRRSAESSRCHRIIFKLINAIHATEIVELGTSVGIGTAYMASTSERCHVTTFEGSTEIAKVAQKTWQRLSIKNITPIVGNINDSLPPYISEQRDKDSIIDFAFIDANHTYEATLKYFDLLTTATSENSIIVIDDIYHSPQMQHAWQEICKKTGITASLDCYNFGILFFNRQYEKRNYKLRI